MNEKIDLTNGSNSDAFCGVKSLLSHYIMLIILCMDEREVKSRGRGQADKLIEILPGGRYKRRIGEFLFVYRCLAECVRRTEWGL